MSKVESYPLYQTLSCKLSKKEPPLTQKKVLCESINGLYEEQKKVFIRLILEHARINDHLSLEKIPYGGTDKDGTITFDISSEEFPTELKWILLKFFKICSTGES